VIINALVAGNIASVKQQIEQRLDKNYRSIKVKVGRQPLNEEINLIQDIHRKIDKTSTLRLDANCAWKFKEAVYFVNSVKDLAIEYIEEPLINPEKLPDLYKVCDLPIALDESLIEMSPDNFRPEEWINTIILKPSVIGSVQKTLQYISLAKKYGIKVVISDTFHSGIGLSFLIRLASIIDKTTAMGFDTYRWLNDDILIDRLPVENGCFDLKTVMDRCNRVDYSKLEHITHPGPFHGPPLPTSF
jgi:O-succinylbenzoate synthase